MAVAPVTDFTQSEPVNITKIIRTKHGFGLNSFADYAEVKPQTILRTDQGTYRRIPTQVLIALRTLEPATSANELHYEYRLFVEAHRKWTWMEKPLKLHFLPDNSLHPLIYMRNSSGYTTRMGFCTSFCLHPSTVRRFELGLTRAVPQQIVEMFADVSHNADSIVSKLQHWTDQWLRSPKKETSSGYKTS